MHSCVVNHFGHASEGNHVHARHQELFARGHRVHTTQLLEASEVRPTYSFASIRWIFSISCGESLRQLPRPMRPARIPA